MVYIGAMATDHPLRNWRRANGITLAALATSIGVYPSYLSMIETRKKTPSLDVAAKLSRATANQVLIDEFVSVEVA